MRTHSLKWALLLSPALVIGLSSRGEAIKGPASTSSKAVHKAVLHSPISHVSTTSGAANNRPSTTAIDAQLAKAKAMKGHMAGPVYRGSNPIVRKLINPKPITPVTRKGVEVTSNTKPAAVKILEKTNDGLLQQLHKTPSGSKAHAQIQQQITNNNQKMITEYDKKDPNLKAGLQRFQAGAAKARAKIGAINAYTVKGPSESSTYDGYGHLMTVTVSSPAPHQNALQSLHLMDVYGAAKAGNPAAFAELNSEAGKGNHAAISQLNQLALHGKQPAITGLKKLGLPVPPVPSATTINTAMQSGDSNFVSDMEDTLSVAFGVSDSRTKAMSGHLKVLNHLK